MKKNKIFLVLFLIISIIFSLIFKNSFAYKDEYTREEIQEIVVSTALSYYYNNYFSDYGQKSMDNLGIENNYYNDGTFYWRDLNITPEMVSRSNYYHIDCSGFTFITYLNSIGYDMSEYKDISSYTLFNGDNINENNYYMQKVNTFSNISKSYKEAYIRFGQGWNNNYLEKVANKISNTCKTDTCLNSNKTKEIYNNLNNEFENELVYYYISNGTEEENQGLEESYSNIKEYLQPGDIIRYITHNNTTNSSSGHVLLYIGTPAGIEKNSFLHSTGNDYNTNETSELNRLRKNTSIVRSDADVYLENRIKEANEKGNYIEAFMIIRPINTVCKNEICNITNNTNITLTETQLKNNDARVELNRIRIEQWMYTNENYDYNIKSKYNSINIGEEITYKLRLTNEYDNTNNGIKIKITSEIPTNSEFITCTPNCTYENNLVTWELNEFSGISETYKDYTYTIKALSDGILSNNGMKITTENGNELQMSKLDINVNSTNNNMNKEQLESEINKFINLYKDGKITYSTSGITGENTKDLDTLTSAQITSFGFIKMVYYNAYNIDLDSIDGINDSINSKKIKDAIFKKMEYPTTLNSGEIYTGDNTTSVYTKLKESDLTELTGAELNISKMLVPGMYGGKLLKGNDNNDRIKFLRSFKTNGINSSDLEYGDIIVTFYGENQNYIKTYLYLGFDENGPILARFINNTGIVKYTDEYLGNYDATNSAQKPSNQILNELFDEDLFVILRPTRLAKTIYYNYNNNINNSSKIIYNHTSTLPIPQKTGYKFEGWYSDNEFNNKVGEAGDEYTIEDSQILYGKWSISQIDISNNYEIINNNIILNIGTTTEDLDLELDNTYIVKTYNKNNIEKESKIYCTGDIIKIFLDNNLINEYKVVIKGDINGTGTIDKNDIAIISKHIINNNIIAEEYLLAANIDNNDKIDINDVIKLVMQLTEKNEL